MKEGASGNVAMGAGLRPVGESRGDTTGPYSARARDLSRQLDRSRAAPEVVSGEVVRLVAHELWPNATRQSTLLDASRASRLSYGRFCQS
jgi:hypothetical protein